MFSVVFSVNQSSVIRLPAPPRQLITRRTSERRICASVSHSREQTANKCIGDEIAPIPSNISPPPSRQNAMRSPVIQLISRKMWDRFACSLSRSPFALRSLMQLSMRASRAYEPRLATNVECLYRERERCRLKCIFSKAETFAYIIRSAPPTFIFNPVRDASRPPFFFTRPLKGVK